jgi:hypothetical protein
MKKRSRKTGDDGLRAEYDLAEIFPDDESVNRALRILASAAANLLGGLQRPS